ncbi:GTPase IMAP family member 9-like [Littorina saxatilis]|uniref:AIG1-type G domain-containing protein n=1 Tax=Littorina saxatilis TaxID=31220 RepID=A0AAN9BM47_9CAEN
MEDTGSSQAFPATRMRIILIGKTGAGKSTTGNTILGAEEFHAQVGINSVTSEGGIGYTERYGQELMVLDTPGLCDTQHDITEISKRITRSLLLVAPGPHAIILVLKCNERFTEEQIKVLDALKDIFGPQMTSYMIVILVGKDELDMHGENFEEQLEKAEKLKKVLQEADNRYLLFNNRGDVYEKELMVGKLLEMVNQVVSQNGGCCFRHRISRELDGTMSKMVTEEIRKITGQTIPIISEEAEYSQPRSTRPKSPKQISGQGSPMPPHEAGIGTAEDDFSHSALQAVNSKQEVYDLHMRGAVKTRLQQFSKPEPKSPEAEFRQRTPIQSPRNSFEIKEARGGQHSELVCHWKSDEAQAEEVLDQMLRKLKTNDDAPFIYDIPDKPKMTLADKQRLIEDALRKKIMNKPEQLNEAQKEEMKKVVKSVGQKIKGGMTKFAVKAIDQCSLM